MLSYRNSLKSRLQRGQNDFQGWSSKRKRETLLWKRMKFWKKYQSCKNNRVTLYLKMPTGKRKISILVEKDFIRIVQDRKLDTLLARMVYANKDEESYMNDEQTYYMPEAINRAGPVFLRSYFWGNCRWSWTWTGATMIIRVASIGQ